MPEISGDNIAAIAVAFLAMMGVVAQALFQFWSNRKVKKNQEAEAATQRQQAAEAESRRLERENASVQIQQQLAELSASITRRFDGMERDVGAMQETVQTMWKKFDALKEGTEERINTQATQIASIMKILQRNSHQYSAMMRMHQQTDSRLQTLMDIESYNLKFSRDAASSLQIVGEVLYLHLKDTAGDDGPSPFEDRLRATLSDVQDEQQQFVDKILKAQKIFFSQGRIGILGQSTGDDSLDDEPTIPLPTNGDELS